MKKSCDVGGQALIEGVMMRGKKTVAIAVRKPDGFIEVKCDPLPDSLNNKLFKLPIIRGVVGLISSMTIGIAALNYSADLAGFEEEEDTKFDKWLKDTFKDKADGIISAITVLISLGLAALMFGALPTFFSSFFKGIIQNSVLLSLVEGLIKLTMFVAYIYLISNLKDIRRVFEYHGAEHMSIHCLEAGLDLTPENASQFSPVHPRCGTSFLAYLMIISILVYSFISWESVIGRVVLKMLLLPLIAGLGYEVLKINAKHDNAFLRMMSKPGLWLQSLTTKKPDASQLEVAIAALKAVLNAENSLDGCNL